MPLLDDGDDFGTRLRGLRLARALSQQELAGEEMSVSYVSLLETGKRAPSEAVLAVLASRLGCSADFLLTGRADKDREPILLKITFGDIALQNGDHGEALQAFSGALAARPLLRPEEHRQARLAHGELALVRVGQRPAPGIEGCGGHGHGVRRKQRRRVEELAPLEAFAVGEPAEVRHVVRIGSALRERGLELVVGTAAVAEHLDVPLDGGEGGAQFVRDRGEEG